MAKHRNNQTQNRRNSRSSLSKSKKTRNTRKQTYRKKSTSQYEECYIVAHGCHLPSQFIIPYNMSLAFNAPLNQPFCGDTTNVDWEPSKYPYIIDTDTTNDYFLDFVDETSDLFSSFGVYFKGQKMYGGLKDVILSQVLNYISTLTTKPIRVYCSICRSQCPVSDEDKYNEKIKPEMAPFQNMSPDDYAFLDDLATLGPEI